jgi:hypothetical protein
MSLYGDKPDGAKTVSVMTIDSAGKPHMLDVSPYCIVLPAEEEERDEK